MGRTQKSHVIAIGFSILLVLFSCKNPNTHKPDVEVLNSGPLVVADKQSKELSLDTSKSKVYWKAYKMIGNGHEGTLKCSTGKIWIKDSLPAGGEIILDMESIAVTDITDPEKNQNLVSHLKDADFFETQKFQTATLKILGAQKKSGNKVLVKVSLEIKGAERELELLVDVIWKGDVMQFSGETTINRKDWGINYHSEGSVSGLAKDKIIKDEVNIRWELIAL